MTNAPVSGHPDPSDPQRDQYLIGTTGDINMLDRDVVKEFLDEELDGIEIPKELSREAITMFVGRKPTSL
jgi:hypothetical protein